jgi:phosphatidylinositol phospholipase C beta
MVTIFQNEKLNNTLMKLGDNVEERSLTICSGTDYININYQHVVCPDVETAKVSMWMCHIG